MKQLYVALCFLFSLTAGAQYRHWVALPAQSALAQVHHVSYQLHHAWNRLKGRFEPFASIDSILVSPGLDSIRLHLRAVGRLDCLDTNDFSQYLYYGPAANAPVFPEYPQVIRGDSLFLFPYQRQAEFSVPPQLTIERISGNERRFLAKHFFGIHLPPDTKSADLSYYADTLETRLPACGGTWITAPLRNTAGFHLPEMDAYVRLNHKAIATIDLHNKTFFSTTTYDYIPESQLWVVDMWVDKEKKYANTMDLKVYNFGSDTLKIARCNPSKGFSTLSNRADMMSLVPGQWSVLTFTFDREAIQRGDEWTGYFYIEFENPKAHSQRINYILRVRKE